MVPHQPYCEQHSPTSQRPVEAEHSPVVVIGKLVGEGEEVLELVPVVERLTDVELETRVAVDDMALVELTAAEVETGFPQVPGAENAGLQDLQ